MSDRSSALAAKFRYIIAPTVGLSILVACVYSLLNWLLVAPGHCTGEPTFNALRKAFGDRYIYAGLGSRIPLNSEQQAAIRSYGRVVHTPRPPRADARLHDGY